MDNYIKELQEQHRAEQYADRNQYISDIAKTQEGDYDLDAIYASKQNTVKRIIAFIKELPAAASYAIHH